MIGLRSLLAGGSYARRILMTMPTPLHAQKQWCHHDGPPMPFDNMPFKIKNRFLTTVFFMVFFGAGLWAPFIIVWYSMAKRTL